MTTKEYLSRAYGFKKDINTRTAQIRALREVAERSTSSVNALRVGGTSERSPMANAVDKIIDCQKLIQRDIDRLLGAQKEIAETISKVENHTYRQVLELRYLSFKKWWEIADILDKTERWIFKLHGKALQEISKIICDSSL